MKARDHPGVTMHVCVHYIDVAGIFGTISSIKALRFSGYRARKLMLTLMLKGDETIQRTPV